MTKIINLTHSPPRVHTFSKETLDEAKRLAGHTLQFANEAPDWHKALIHNIAHNIEGKRHNDREAPK